MICKINASLLGLFAQSCVAFFLCCLLVPHETFPETRQFVSARRIARAGNSNSSDDRGSTLPSSPALVAKGENTVFFGSLGLMNQKATLRDDTTGTSVTNIASPNTVGEFSLRASLRHVFFAVGASRTIDSNIEHTALESSVGQERLFPSAHRIFRLNKRRGRTEGWIAMALRPLESLSVGASIKLTRSKISSKRHRVALTEADLSPLENTGMELSESHVLTATSLKPVLGLYYAPYKLPLEISAAVGVQTQLAGDHTIQFDTLNHPELNIDQPKTQLAATLHSMSSDVALRFLGQVFSIESNLGFNKNLSAPSSLLLKPAVEFSSNTRVEKIDSLNPLFSLEPPSYWHAGIAADVLVLNSAVLLQMGYSHQRSVNDRSIAANATNRIGLGAEFLTEQAALAIGVGYRWTPKRTFQYSELTPTLLEPSAQPLQVSLTNTESQIYFSMDIDVSF